MNRYICHDLRSLFSLEIEIPTYFRPKQRCYVRDDNICDLCHQPYYQEDCSHVCDECIQYYCCQNCIVEFDEDDVSDEKILEWLQIWLKLRKQKDTKIAPIMVWIWDTNLDFLQGEKHQFLCMECIADRYTSANSLSD